MLCEQCKSREATVRFKAVVNGSEKNMHLCGVCAQKKQQELWTTALNMDGFLSDLMMGAHPAPAKHVAAGTCPACGIAAAEIAKTGKVGCGACYTHFEALLKPYLHRLYGDARHTGGTPGNYKESREAQIKKLEGALSKAVFAQEFEEAARLRDQIRDIKNTEEDAR